MIINRNFVIRRPVWWKFWQKRRPMIAPQVVEIFPDEPSMFMIVADLDGRSLQTMSEDEVSKIGRMIGDHFFGHPGVGLTNWAHLDQNRITLIDTRHKTVSPPFMTWGYFPLDD